MKLGTGIQGELTLMDLLGILSFLVGLQNLNENLTQNDKAELQRDLTEKTQNLAGQIHEHLERQDAKLNYIIKLLEEKK